MNETTVPIPTYVDPNDPDNSSIIFLPVDRSVPSDFQQKQFVDQVNDNMNSFIGFNLSIPIFNRMQTKNNVQSSRLQYELSQLQLKQEKNSSAANYLSISCRC
ncbi:MAG: TolC family protein [Owenweeksia sp.]|nr:TolC family protein [Owenweeksia sp.]